MKCTAFGFLQLLLCFLATYAQRNCSQHANPIISVGADFVEICCSDEVWIGKLKLSQDTERLESFVIDDLKKVNATPMSGSDNVLIPLLLPFDNETNLEYDVAYYHYYVVCSRLTVDPNCPLRCIIVRPCGCNCNYSNSWLRITIRQDIPKLSDAEMVVKFEFGDRVVPLNMSYSYYFWRNYPQCTKSVHTWVEDGGLVQHGSFDNEVKIFQGGDNNSCEPLVAGSSSLQSFGIRDAMRYRYTYSDNNPTITAGFNQNGAKLTELYFSDSLWVNTTFIAQRLEDMLQHNVSLPSYIAGTTTARKAAIRDPVRNVTFISLGNHYYDFPFPIDISGNFSQHMKGLCISHSKQESSASANMSRLHGIILLSAFLSVATVYFAYSL